jgi:hypothetical protein
MHKPIAAEWESESEMTAAPSSGENQNTASIFVL